MKFGFVQVSRNDNRETTLNGVEMKPLKHPIQYLASLVLVAAAAHADGQPEQKIGLWQRTSQTTQDGKAQAPEKSQHCVDAATLDMVKRALATAAKQCTKYNLRQMGGKWTLDSVCTFGATTLTLHQETLMKGDVAYHSESDSSYSPGGRSRTVTDGVWIGSCKK